MLLLPLDIAALVEADKRLFLSPKWDDKSDARYFVFTVPLYVINSEFANFELRTKVSKQHAARDALMQLELSGKDRRDRIELIRCQWRPFETHTNKNWGPPGFEFAEFVSTSHIHTFRDNYVAIERRMRTGSLPSAIPIEPDATTLSDFFAICGETLRISDISLVRPPGESLDMFWVPL